jgi:nucleoside-diphosphate-sugar epimerase
MKFIITGGAGFIGHNVVRQLEAKGHTCLVIDSATNYGFIPKAEMNHLIEERKKRYKANINYIDLREHLQVRTFFEDNGHDVDAVIHLASFPRQKIVGEKPLWASEVMCPALINLLEETVRHKIPRFVYISSSMVYGNFFNDVAEDDCTCNPMGLYGIMKYMGEKIVEDYATRFPMDFVIIRPSAVYGEYDVEDRVVSKFMLNAMRGAVLKVNGPDEVLDFTYVEDAAQGIVLAATVDAAANQIFNITRSDTKLYTLEKAAEIAVSIAGKGSIEVGERDPNFPKRGRLNITKARLLLGYTPLVSVEEGFKRYHEWFQNDPYWSKTL